MQEIKDRIAEALKLKGKTPKQLSDLRAESKRSPTSISRSSSPKIKEPIQGS